jgi:hypothetical protein
MRDDMNIIKRRQYYVRCKEKIITISNYNLLSGLRQDLSNNDGMGIIGGSAMQMRYLVRQGVNPLTYIVIKEPLLIFEHIGSTRKVVENCLCIFWAKENFT